MLMVNLIVPKIALNMTKMHCDILLPGADEARSWSRMSMFSSKIEALTNEGEQCSLGQRLNTYSESVQFIDE